MTTLYVENVREDLYEALRARARANKKSISSEVIGLLSENVPTNAELLRRRQMLDRARAARLKRGPTKARFASTEEMQREGRQR